MAVTQIDKGGGGDGRGVGLDEHSAKSATVVEKTVTISSKKCCIGVS